MLYANNPLDSNYPSVTKGILDSGSSGNFLTSKSPQKNITQQSTPLNINQPDGKKLQSEHKSELLILPQVSQMARESYAFKNITFPLISVAKLCDSDCTVVFVKTKAFIIHKGKIISEAPRDTISKLWTIDLQNQNDYTKKYEKDIAMNVTIHEEAENNTKRMKKI